MHDPMSEKAKACGLGHVRVTGVICPRGCVVWDASFIVN